MAMLKAFVSVATMALLLQLAVAADYTVGAPNGGWNLMTSLQAWANSQTFFAGDTLTFVYSANDDVREVSKPDYDACLGNNSIQTYTGGNTVITLTSLGNRYFISGTPGSCDRGMKVVIITLAAPAPPPATPSVPPSATPSPATPSGSPTASPARSPVSSPSPKEAAPMQSPTKAPKMSPSASPSKSPIRSPSKSPSISPVSSPTESSTESPAILPFPSDSSPSTTPSSASKIHVVAALKLGLGLIIMMLLIQ